MAVPYRVLILAALLVTAIVVVVPTFTTPVIHSFAFALLVGFIIGTYSSIVSSTPIALFVESRRRRAP